MVTVRVPLSAGGDASYRVLVAAGGLTQLASHVTRDCPATRYAVISDDIVAPLYGDAVAAHLTAAGLPAEVHRFPAGEAHKSRATWTDLTDALLAARHGRDSAIVAVGGGVTGDVAGFTAATLHRGIPVVQVPTSTVAMIDAAVGGKTGVDTPAGKNLVGAFHQPRLVVADPDTLRTLPHAAYTAGLAEAVKHGVVADVTYLEFLEQQATAVLARDATVLVELVSRSVEIKAAIVAADPRDTGLRAALNFGHTVAHAIEATSGYTVPHGHAVAVGMVVEASLGEAASRWETGTADRIATALTRFGLPVRLPPAVRTDALLAAMRPDKKTRGGVLHFSIPPRMGAARDPGAAPWTVAIGDDVVHAELTRSAAGSSR